MRKYRHGYFITLEGGEGTGKTTMVQRLGLWAYSHDFTYEIMNDPSKAIPESVLIRDILLNEKHKNLTPEVELLLYLAARKLLDIHMIEPALKEGNLVICDRYADSTIVYQGMARNRLPSVKRVIKATKIGIEPDLTFYLDVDPRIGVVRSLDRLSDANVNEGRFENMDLSFHEKLREGYLKLAKKKPRIHVIDATGPENVVWNQIKMILDKKLSRMKRKII